MASGRLWPSRPRAGPVARQARSSVVASVAREEEAMNDAELLDPRVAAVKGEVRSARGGGEMGLGQG